MHCHVLKAIAETWTKGKKRKEKIPGHWVHCHKLRAVAETSQRTRARVQTRSPSGTAYVCVFTYTRDSTDTMYIHTHTPNAHVRVSKLDLLQALLVQIFNHCIWMYVCTCAYTHTCVYIDIWGAHAGPSQIDFSSWAMYVNIYAYTFLHICMYDYIYNYIYNGPTQIDFSSWATAA